MWKYIFSLEYPADDGNSDAERVGGIGSIGK